MNKIENLSNVQKQYIYTYVHQTNEYDLSRMEMRAFFGFNTKTNYLFSPIAIDPSRSPFIEERLEIYFKSKELTELKRLLEQLKESNSTFKVMNLNNKTIGELEKIHLPERRKIERELGLAIKGEPDLENPEEIYGVIRIEDYWYFGKYEKSESIWRYHLHKPKSYSTALNTRVARAIANIAVPFPENVRAIDPCCGIGTVLVEAASMGIHIIGRDISPLVCFGARENIAHFGYDCPVVKGPIAEVEEHYDVAIIDLPYNIYTHISPEEQMDLIRQARRIADRVVFVSVETIDQRLRDVGFNIIDRCVIRKHLFERQILLCE